jgi:hypothetical protein
MRRTVWVLAGSLTVGAAFAGTRIDIGRFSAGDLSQWQPKSFKGETRYTLRDGTLCAESEASASGLFRELRVDLGASPVLHWSWQLGRAPATGDERSKPGDDYAARVYVVFSGGALFWRTRAINYVWSASQPVGTEWPNAFTANARMIAVESGTVRAGEWVEEQRDVRADFRRLFGDEPPAVDAVALMTDTDNGGGSAAACYGDIWFAG